MNRRGFLATLVGFPVATKVATSLPLKAAVTARTYLPESISGPKQIVKGAMILLGVLAMEEVPADSEYLYGLGQLRDLLFEWEIPLPLPAHERFQVECGLALRLAPAYGVHGTERLGAFLAYLPRVR